MDEREPPYVSLVIPAYNEEGRLPRTLAEIQKYLAGSGMTFEILVVDDGSADATRDVVAKAGMNGAALRLIANETNRGKGFSVRRGMLEAGGRYVFYADADLSTPIEELKPLLEKLESGYDVVIGSRGMASSRLEIRQPRHRETMGRLFNLAVRTLVLPGLHDTQCGFKGFRREATGDIFRRQRLDRFAFDVEVLHIARRRGYRILEVPIRWMDSPRSKVHVLKDSGRMLLDLFRIRINDMAGRYN